MKNPLRVAIVGCGRMGKIRADACTTLGARISLAVDPDMSRAQELAHGLPNVRTEPDPKRIDWNEIDAVFLCDPPGARVPVTLAAIRHAVPFFVEKPIATSVADALAIQQSLAASPVITAVGYMNRYRDSIISAKEEIAAGRAIGLSARWINSVYKVPWWRESNVSGGEINEQATHFVDLARYMMGEVRSVYCVEQRDAIKPDWVVSASIALQFENGTVGSFLYSCGARYKAIQFAVQMEDKELSWNEWDLLPAGAAIPADHDRNAIFQKETNAFLSAICNGTDTIQSNFHDAVKTQRVIESIRRSAVSGKREPVSHGLEQDFDK
jgi:myo-inositol 2-dehydrogenase/D-chiro-inositol 1-dehydrogenase